MWKVLRAFPRNPGALKLLAAPSWALPPPCWPGRSPGYMPSIRALRGGVLGGEGPHDAAAWLRAGEGAGVPQGTPGGASQVGRGSPPACVWSPVPRPSVRSSRALQATVLPALLPSAPCCACFAPPLLGPRCLHCLPRCLHLVSYPARFPAHVGSQPPGCELLGGRPSINVTCCCQLCGQPRASAAWLTELSAAPWCHSSCPHLGARPPPSRAGTVGAAAVVVFIRLLTGLQV